MRIQSTQSKEILLTTHAGLATVGALLSHTRLPQRLNRSTVKGMENPIHSHGDVMTSYLGLLCQGKSDFDHIEPFRKDPVFQTCLGVRKVPSSPTLRQRLDAAAQTMNANWNEILLQESADLIRNVKAPVTGLTAGEHTMIPLDTMFLRSITPVRKKRVFRLNHQGQSAQHIQGKLATDRRRQGHSL
ncbi:hypothetical protein IJ21_17180 [Paenibacillus sp. 32O-W]|nr:hypothetical protein [Paenibacillus sp. 32O-W]ALS27119.1 hypothetical protein IJ21_17180 [Paenibacillus sp. 32O-W]